MRIALLVIALIGCKAKTEKAISAPASDEEVAAQIGSGSAGSGSLGIEIGPALRGGSAVPKDPACEAYDRAVAVLIACDKYPAGAKQAFIDIGTSGGLTMRPSDCRVMADGLRTALEAAGCSVEGLPSRDVPSERGVPLDRAVLGSMPRPFGALQPIKPTMTRDEILAAVPDARRDGEDIVVPLGVETLTAKILIDSNDHISDIEIAMDPFPEDLFQQAWGESPDKVWFDRRAMWRADYGGGDFKLHIFPYRLFADVIGTGPELLADKTVLVGEPIATLREKLGGRIDDWTEQDEEGNDVTRPRLLLPSTELCHYDTMYVLEMYDHVVTGATLTQCYDDEESRKRVMAAMEKRWGRAVPARTADDRLVFRFSRPGRLVEMTEDPTVDPAGAWVVKIKKR